MTDATDNSIFAVVLAAGSGTRFGSAKQLAQLDGAPLIKRAVTSAADAYGPRLALVVGHEWRSVTDVCMPLDGFLIANERFTDGMGTSLAQAVRSLRHATQAIVVVLGDQPLITAAHLQALGDAWSGAHDEIVATAFADTVGPPVLLPRACFPDLTALDGDSGARSLLNDDRFSVKSVRFEDAAVDIDTVADIDKLVVAGTFVSGSKAQRSEP